MGLAGQLSLGHALHVGLGAYVAAMLWVYLGVGPWLGVFPAIAAAALAGAAIAWLGCRFSIEGVYFALSDHRVRRVHPDRVRSHRRGRRGGRILRSLPGAAPGRMVESARRAGAVLLRRPCAGDRRGDPHGLAQGLAARLSMARGAGGSAGGARARHRHPRRQDEGRADLLGDDRRRAACSTHSTTTACFRRRCSASAARSSSMLAPIVGGLRNHIRPGGGRVHPHAARRALTAGWSSSASMRPAPRRCSTA